MTVKEMLNAAQFLVDTDGTRKAVVLDYSLWQELIEMLEDLEDIEELQNLQNADKETIPWEQAKVELRAEGVNV